MALHKIKSALLGRRTYSIPLQAIARAREGSIYIVRLIPIYLKRLRAAHRDSNRFGERQFSLDDTPIFHFKLRKHKSSTRLKYLPSFPCMTSAADLEECDEVHHQNGRNNYFGRDEECRDSDCGNDLQANIKLNVPYDDENIDSKAEEFIERVHEQMKLQRQVSYLQYVEMLSRGAS